MQRKEEINRWREVDGKEEEEEEECSRGREEEKDK